MKLKIVPAEQGYGKVAPRLRTAPKGTDIGLIVERAVKSDGVRGAVEEAVETADNTASTVGRVVEVMCDKFMLTPEEVYYILEGKEPQDGVKVEFVF
jgi:hypothetical protein